MFEAYSVGVRLQLIDGVSRGLSTMSRLFAKTNTEAKALQLRLNRIKTLGVVGAAIGGAGFMGLGTIAKAIKPAEEYAHQLAQMNVSGMKQLEIVKSINAAWEAGKVIPTSSAMENLKAIRELRMVFGNTSEAIQFMPAVQKVDAVLQSLLHMEKGQAHDQAYDVAKALEMKGAIKTPEMFLTEANLMTKAMIASGGKISPADFHLAFKYGRAATIAWDNDFTYKILPTLIQEMKTKGGSGGGQGGPGTAMMSAYSAIVGGRVQQKALQLWRQLGLVDLNKAVWTKVGELKGIRPGGIRGSEEFQANPFNWSQNHLNPALKAHGYVTEAQQRQALQYLFPNRTAGFLMTQMVLQPWKFARDKVLIEQAGGVESYNKLLKTDPVMAKMGLMKQWESLQASLAYTILPELIGVYTKMSKVIKTVIGFTRKHETTTKLLVGAFVGLLGVMAISGPIIVLTQGFKGLSLIVRAISGMAGIPAVSTAFSSLLKIFTGPAGLCVAVATASYGIGTLISKLIDWSIQKFTGKKGARLGTVIYDWLHPNENSNIGVNSVRPGNNIRQPLNNSITLQVDKRVLGHVTAQSMAEVAGRPLAGISTFDGSMGLAPVGY